VALIAGLLSCGRDDAAPHGRVAASRLDGGSIAGESAQYTYDGAGNLVQIASATVPSVSIVVPRAT